MHLEKNGGREGGSASARLSERPKPAHGADYPMVAIFALTAIFCAFGPGVWPCRSKAQSYAGAEDRAVGRSAEVEHAELVALLDVLAFIDRRSRLQPCPPATRGATPHLGY